MLPLCTSIKIHIKYWERNLRILLTKEGKWEMVERVEKGKYCSIDAYR